MVSITKRLPQAEQSYMAGQIQLIFFVWRKSSNWKELNPPDKLFISLLETYLTDAEFHVQYSQQLTVTVTATIIMDFIKPTNNCIGILIVSWNCSRLIFGITNDSPIPDFVFGRNSTVQSNVMRWNLKRHLLYLKSKITEVFLDARSPSRLLILLYVTE